MVYAKKFSITLSESNDIEAILESSSTLSSLSNTCAWSVLDAEENEGKLERVQEEDDVREMEEDRYDEQREASLEKRNSSSGLRNSFSSRRLMRKNLKKNKSKSEKSSTISDQYLDAQNKYRKDQKNSQSTSVDGSRDVRSNGTLDEQNGELYGYPNGKHNEEDESQGDVQVAIKIHDSNREGYEESDYDDIDLDDSSKMDVIPTKGTRKCFIGNPRKIVSAVVGTALVIFALTLTGMFSRKSTDSTPEFMEPPEPTILDAKSIKWEQVQDSFSGPSLGSTLVGGSQLMSVSMAGDGKRVSIGYPGFDNRGLVQVYEENQIGLWTKLGEDIRVKEDNVDELSLNAFGSAISMSQNGDFVAIGDKWRHHEGERRGSVNVFGLKQGSWSPVGNTIYGLNNYDQSGTSISLSADAQTIAIGIAHHDANGIYDSGQVRIFSLTHFNDTETWDLLGSPLNGEHRGELFGSSVSISSDGTRLAVGAPRSIEQGIVSGSAKIFDQIYGVWKQLGQNITGKLDGEEFGSSVSLSSDGTTVAIGSSSTSFGNTSVGLVQVYQYDMNTWKKLGSDLHGQMTSLSADGTRLAVGAPKINRKGFNSGATKLYHLNSDDWFQLGRDIDNFSGNHQAGFAVSLSGNGTRVAVAAPGAESNTGLVQVYDLAVYF